MSTDDGKSGAEDRGGAKNEVQEANLKAGAATPDQNAPANAEGGEDESSTSQDGQDDHLHEDQKPTTK